MKCRYCNHYQTSGDRRTIPVSEKNVMYQRFCGIKVKFVGAEETACDFFIITKNFWCKKDECWLDLVVCENRQNLWICKCRQGKDVLSSLRRKEGTKNNLIQRTSTETTEISVKPKIIKREIQVKPILKRREL